MDERIVVCSACGGVNRLVPGRQSMAAKCGKCGHRLFTAHPRDVDGPPFNRHRARSTLPVLVDVWAPWCGPCRMMAPAYEAATRELEPDVVLLKLNSDNETGDCSGETGDCSGTCRTQYTDDDPVQGRQGSGAAVRCDVVRTDCQMGS